MRIRFLLMRIVPLALAVMLVLAPNAFAENDGRGYYGATDDKVVTRAGFILIIFFPTFVFLMSRLQSHLEKRKQARLEASRSQLGNGYLHGGW
jgi:hypothetical protein